MTLPDWLEPLPDAHQMRAMDSWAIEERGVPSLDLMERAGEGLANVTAEAIPEGRIVVVCGKGNNGGDGLVAARHLRNAGREVCVVLLGDAGDLRGDPADNLARLPGEPPRPWSWDVLEGSAGAIDAILGTGSAGAPHGRVAEAIGALVEHGAPIVAADVPSGVDASTGTAPGVVVRAVATATFHAAKPGLWIHPGKELSGEVHVIEIGIPAGAPSDAHVGLLGPRPVALAPSRSATSTKFSSGKVVLLGGSRGLTGAPSLAADAAARAGAGYVIACVPRSVEIVLEMRLVEVMTKGLPDEDGSLVAGGLDQALEMMSGAGSVVVGPGLGPEESARRLARLAAAQVESPLVIDADALNAHIGCLEKLQSRRAATVLTPHSGELARMLDVERQAVEAARLAHVRAAADRTQAIVVLKGDDTLIAEPEGRVAVSRGGSPGLATAGTGDVLSGVVAAFLARGVAPWPAACIAVQVHAEAGRLAAERLGGPDGVIARDVIDVLPLALPG